MDFKLAKTKIFLMAFISFMIFLLALYTTVFPEQVSDFFKMPLLTFVIGIFTGLVSLICFIMAILVYTRKSGLIINDEGIVDTSSLVSVGLIKWADIVRIKKIEVNSIPFLMIYTKNQEEYLRNFNKLKVWWMRSNAKSFGSAISISPIFLNCKLSELEGAINEGYKKFSPDKNVDIIS